MKKRIMTLSIMLTMLLSCVYSMLYTYAEEVDVEEIDAVVVEEEEIVVMSEDDWEVLSDSLTMENTFTRNGINYKVVSTINARGLNESNIIYNLNNGKSYTYSYYRGSGTTSEFFCLAGSDYSNLMYSEVYYRLGVENGKNYVQKKIIDNYEKIEVIITTTVTEAGEILHTYDITNIGTISLENTSFIAMLDTELNGNDYIDLYANGDNGVYMSVEDLTLYVEPVEGITKLFAGKWDLNSYSDIDGEARTTSSFGKALGQLLATDVDSAVYVGVDVTSLLVEQTVSFSYQERIVTSAEDRPVPDYMVRVQHINQEGAILDEEFISGIEGETYTVTANDYEEYELYSVVGETTGTFTQSGKTVIFYYGAPRAEYNITVKHVVENGVILSEEVFTAKEGTTYSFEAKEFDGYTFVNVEGETTGVYEENGEVTFYYKTNETPPTVSSSPVTGDGMLLDITMVMCGFSLLAIGIIFVTKRNEHH